MFQPNHALHAEHLPASHGSIWIPTDGEASVRAFPFLLLTSSILLLPAQDFYLPYRPDLRAWLQRAQPLMTLAERTLLEQLTEEQVPAFMGTFLARRMGDAENWPTTGVEWPALYPPYRYGDDRDLAWHLLGPPKQEVTEAAGVRWIWPELSLLFTGGQSWRLAPAGREALARRTLQRDVPYSLTAPPLVPAGLPEDKPHRAAQMEILARTPEASGMRFFFKLGLGPALGLLPRTDAPRQVEFLVKLRSGEVEKWRHTTASFHGSTPEHLYFSLVLPPGAWDAQCLAYAGFMPSVLQSRIFLLVPAHPTLGTPLLAGSRSPTQEMEAPGGWLSTGSHFYELKLSPADSGAEFLIIPCQGVTPTVLALFPDGRAQTLKGEMEKQAWVGSFSAQLAPASFLAFDPGGPSFAWLANISNRLANGLPGGGMAREFMALPPGNNLSWQELALPEENAQAFLLVAGQPWSRGPARRIPWEPLLLPAKVPLEALAIHATSRWRSYQAELSQGEQVESLAVRPNHLVFQADRNEEIKLRPLLRGQRLSEAPRPLLHAPQTWGVVVDSAALRHPEWPQLRAALLDGLMRLIRPQDELYLVTLEDRARLLLAPTKHKVRFFSAWQALEPGTTETGVQDPHHLLQSLAYLKTSTGHPHHVLLLSPPLRPDVETWQRLLSDCRHLGLFFHHWEMPEEDLQAAEFPSWQERLHSGTQSNPQGSSIAQAEDFQEERNTKAGFSLRFGKKKQLREAQQAALRAEAARESLSRQLSLRSAGHAQKFPRDHPAEKVGQAMQDLKAWVETLWFQALPQYATEADIGWTIQEVRGEKYQETAANPPPWTLVETPIGP